MPRLSPLSPFNTRFSTGGQPKQVAIREMTLRQLGHMEAEMTFDEKLYFLARLDEIGVKETVLWGVEADAADLVVQARDRGLGIGIALFGKTFFPEAMRATVAKARACGAPLVRFNARGGEFSREVTGESRREELDACLLAVKVAKDAGVPISIGPAYATQTDPEYLEELTATVVE
ncbi:MAG: hypothetical protein HY329_00050, partial [Chloroflexi bacterium]|nr:hypothetical protein [Chloroflexota bacterium]